MKNPLPPFLTFVVIAYLLFLASNLLFKFADSSRFWLQQRFAPVTLESHTIFQTVLGKNYIIAPYIDLYYYSSPYFYTPFDAVYVWRQMTESTRYQACASRSQICTPGVAFSPTNRFFDGIFEYYAEKLRDDKGIEKAFYCIGDVLTIGNQEFDEMELTNGTVMMFQFLTPNGMYMLKGVTEAHLEQWKGPCAQQSDQKYSNGAVY